MTTGSTVRCWPRRRTVLGQDEVGIQLFDVAPHHSPPPTSTQLHPWHVGVALVVLLTTASSALFVGPADLSTLAIVRNLLDHLPFFSLHSGLSATGVAVVWQLRMPRIILGALVGAMLSVAGAAYQGAFHNPLADPYLLGVASGAGLGATIAIISLPQLAAWSIDPVPIAAFVGAIAAVVLTFLLGRSTTAGRGATSMILAGIAVGAFFTAAQTFLLQRQNSAILAEVYDWILGGLATAGWSQVSLILPYVIISIVLLIALRRVLDAMSIGDDEAASLGVRADRVRLLVVVVATLGTAAAVSVSGLIGFVGIIVPHTVRLIVGPSYQRILPLSVIYGASFLILADLLARTALSPGEIPLGVVTALLGAPFFLVVLRRSRGLT